MINMNFNKRTIEEHTIFQLDKKKMTTMREKEEDKKFQGYWKIKNEELVLYD